MSCFWCPNWLHISSFKIKQYHRHVCFQCPAKTSLCFARTFPLSWFAEVPIEEQPTLKVAWDLSGKCCKSRKLETTFEINGWDDLGRVIVIRYDFLQLIYFWLFLYNVVGAITCKRNCQAPCRGLHILYQHTRCPKRTNFTDIYDQVLLISWSGAE